MRRTLSIWGPVTVLLGVVYFIRQQERSPWRCWKSFHTHELDECYVNTYDYDDLLFQHRWRHAIVSYDVPTLLNKREAVDACRGNVTTPHSCVGALVLITIKFIGFIAIWKHICVAAIKALWYHKHFSTSLIVVGDSSIWKSFDKVTKMRNAKVSTKWWRDRSQTQRYGGSGTGYGSI